MSENQALRPVLFIDNYFPVIDGVTETVHEYAKHMDAMVVCPEMESRYREKHAFPYEVVTSRTLRVPFIRYASAVPRLDTELAGKIAQAGPDIFHLHSPSLLGNYAVLLGKRMKVPVVATFHSKIYDAIYEFTKSRAISKMVTNRIVRLYESCDEVWACSEETGETLRSYGFRKPYFVMPNGTEASRPTDCDAVKARAAERFCLPRGKHVLLFVGQQIWYKNQRLILDAFRDLLRGVYLNADLLFFPSVFDNAPLVLREAAVLGIPTLATEGSNAAAAIRKNENGFTAPGTPEAMAQEILRIFAEEDVRETGRRAQETIPLPWEKLIPMVLDRYRTVIDRYRSENK